MQLGASKVPANILAEELAQEVAAEVAAEDHIDHNPWGTDDLIDINADQDDWSTFRCFLAVDEDADDAMNSFVRDCTSSTRAEADSRGCEAKTTANR